MPASLPAHAASFPLASCLALTPHSCAPPQGLFTFCNYWLPKHGVLPLNGGCSVGPAGDAAVFVGLSGTGKTTFSTDPRRRVVGDDVLGWGEAGVFNLEGGCYAKTIGLSKVG